MADGHDLAMALRTAYLALHRRTDAALARHGVTADQFVLLAALAEGDAATQRDLARRTGSDPNTVRAMLLLLTARGLIARARHPTDARARTAALTVRGRRTYERLRAAGGRVRARLLAALGPGEPAALLDMLARVSRTMTPPAADKPPEETVTARPAGGPSSPL
jgi:DNA-binding MarR family transcriptional regulator